MHRVHLRQDGLYNKASIIALITNIHVEKSFMTWRHLYSDVLPRYIVQIDRLRRIQCMRLIFVGLCGYQLVEWRLVATFEVYRVVTHEIRNTQTFNDSLILLSMVASDSRLKAPDVNDLILAFFVFAHAYADASLSRMLRNAQGTPSKLHKMNNC